MSDVVLLHIHPNQITMNKAKQTPLFIPAILIAIGMIFILPGKAKSQDTLNDQKEKVISIKINTDDGEELIEIDTTFTLSGTFDEAALEEYLEQLEENLGDLNADIKEMEFHFQDVDDAQVKWQNFGKQYEKMAEKYADQYKNAYKMKFKNMPKGASWVFCDDDHVVKKASRNGEETLIDLIGNVPLKAVTKYRIKKTKDGHRYIIDVDDDYRDYEQDVYFYHPRRSSPRAHWFQSGDNFDVLVDTYVDQDEIQRTIDRSMRDAKRDLKNAKKQLQEQMLIIEKEYQMQEKEQKQKEEIQKQEQFEQQNQSTEPDNG
jgi:Sec-independent protein translocase protein TatA